MLATVIRISAGGLDPGPGLLRWQVKQVLWLRLKNAYADMARMEAVVKAATSIGRSFARRG